MNRLEPLRFRPSLHEKVWGTHDLAPVLGRSDSRVGEAWCLHDESEVAVGRFSGRTLASLVSEFGPRLMGQGWTPTRPVGRQSAGNSGPGAFPILAKLIFAAGRLSVQVHPDNECAQRFGGARGKTELWYVVDAKPGAELGLGITGETDTAQLSSAAHDGSIERLLRWIPARTGHCVLVPAGTVHSARNGVVLCEIQQNSDITCRLYDYRQNGLDGKPRALQVQQAVQAADTALRPDLAEPRTISDRPCRTAMLGRCPHFAAELLGWDRPFLYTPETKRCHLLVFVRGMGSMNAVSFEAGDAFLVPAESGRFPVDGDEALAVRAYLP